MAKKLTDIKIRSLKPDPERRTEIPDGNGLYLILQSSGARSWAVRYRLNGKPQKLTLGSWFAGDVEDAPEPKIGGPLTLKGARALATQAMLAKEKGHDPAATKAKVKEEQERRRKDTFRSIAEMYMKREAGMRVDADGNATGFDESKLRTGRERWLMLQRSIFPSFGAKPISAIKKSDVIDLLDRLADGELKNHKGRKIKGGPGAADRALALLSKIFVWHAVRSDDFRSPVVRGMARVKPRERARDRVLSDGELQIIWRVAGESESTFAAMVRFLLLTAARRAEAAEMTWAEIDGADWVLPASRNKTKAQLLRPLSPAAQAVLEARPKIEGSKYVFSNDGKRPATGFAKAKRKFDEAVLKELRKQDPKAEPLANWTIHDLRRSGRSLMTRAGVISDHAERCLGHVIGGVRGVYDRHEFYDEKKKAYEALAAQIERIVNPPPGNVVQFPQAAGENN